MTFDAKRLGGVGVFNSGGAKNYKGPGLAILSQKVEGPIFASWPPEPTRQLLSGLQISEAESKPGHFEARTADEPREHVTEIVRQLAPRAFRRPVTENEVERFASLAVEAMDQGRNTVDAVKISLRSMLSAPQFMLFREDAGELDDFALANRLSYFLWKSLPDDELFALAAEAKLNDPQTLRGQVERMLKDARNERFIRDFLGQWLRLNKVNATSPDEGLYPEYDELLSDAIPKETHHFFAHMVDQNLALANLIDSDFTFVNRRLAEHYGLEGIEGQHFRRIDLPSDSPRGGILTHASILKTTANGTTTSPVTRGNFVLTNFLGTPPSPPPPGIGSIEPDTRGKTTIREILAAHREIDTCNVCHREIDPPGFALESFDPIGRFRTHYRISGGEQDFNGFIVHLPPKDGLPVDASGVDANGNPFSSIDQFKELLLEQEEQVAKNFVSQLVAYSTGAEIAFADRQTIDEILDRQRESGFPIRDLIHEIVQSRLFRHK